MTTDSVPQRSFIEDSANIINQDIEIQLMSGRIIKGKATKIDRENMKITISGDTLFNTESTEINIIDINREYGIKIKYRGNI
jgi:hypothetical protein